MARQRLDIAQGHGNDAVGLVGAITALKIDLADSGTISGLF